MVSSEKNHRKSWIFVCFESLQNLNTSCGEASSGYESANHQKWLLSTVSPNETPSTLNRPQPWKGEFSPGCVNQPSLETDWLTTTIRVRTWHKGSTLMVQIRAYHQNSVGNTGFRWINNRNRFPRHSPFILFVDWFCVERASKAQGIDVDCYFFRENAGLDPRS